jgi:carboxylesterase
MRKKYFLPLFLLALGGLAALNFFFNETPWGFQESAAYAPADPAQYFSPAVAPIFSARPGHDTLLIFFHGLPSSPQEFRETARALAGEVDVDVPLLPGFGTTPEALVSSNFSQWLAGARAEYLKLRPRYARIYLVGQSLGGTLALRLAETLPPELAPQGVVLLSTPVFLNNLLGAGVYYDWRLYFSRWLALALPKLRVAEPAADQDGAEWVGFKGVKFLRQVHSLKMGMRQARLGLAAAAVPALIMNARGDKTVPFQNGFFIAGRLGSGFIRMRVFDLRAWNHTRHLLSMYRTTRGEVVAEIRRFLQDTRQSAGPAPAGGRP